MRASVPHDVDLEDHLIYGLTPIRFGYLVVAVLGSMAVWGLRWLPAAARLVPCVLLIIAAAALAWGRWRGRPLDRLLVDLGIFLRRNYGIEFALALPRRSRRLATAGLASDMATVSFASINAVGRRRPPDSIEEAA
jgi:hypothetical protein